MVGDKLERDLETVGGFRQNMQAKPESRVLVKALRPAGVVYGALLAARRASRSTTSSRSVM